MKKYFFGIWLAAIFSVSCSTTSNHVTLEADCALSGTVISSEINDAKRGYPYRFMVYLPPCYGSTVEPGYPVIYLIPGRGGSVGDWFNVGVNEIADQLILGDDVPPFILVTGETTNNDPYAADIYTDLIPYIEGNYNALRDRSYRSVAGGSLGGIAAYRLMLMYPEEFASAGLFGSGVINGENEQVIAWLRATTPKNRPRFFINVGEQDPLMLEQAQVMVAILDEQNIPYEFIVGEGAHTYAYWATNFETFFRWVSQDW